MMSSRKRKRLDDDIDALLLSSNAFKRKNKKREKRLKRLDPSLHVRMTERSHHSFLLALKSRVLVVSKERRRKAKTLGLLALQKSYLFRCFFALRARQPFRHQSSQHFLLSLFIFLRVRFLSRPRKSSKD